VSAAGAASVLARRSMNPGRRVALRVCTAAINQARGCSSVGMLGQFGWSHFGLCRVSARCMYSSLV
jgi:hypothetical protein